MHRKISRHLCNSYNMNIKYSIYNIKKNENIMNETSQQRS